MKTVYSVASVVSPHGLQESLHLRTLRCVGWKAREEVLRFARSVLTLTGTRVHASEIEASLVKVRIERQRALKRRDCVPKLSSVRQHDSQVRKDDGIVGLDAFSLSERRLRLVQPPRRGLAESKAEIWVGAGHLGSDRRLEEGHRIGATVRLEQHVPESQVRLRILHIVREDAAERGFERRSLELARHDLRQTRGDLAAIRVSSGSRAVS